LPGAQGTAGFLPGSGSDSKKADGDPSPQPNANDAPADNAPDQSVFTAIDHAASPAVVAALHYLPTVLLAGLVIALLAFGLRHFLSRRRATAAPETAPVLSATLPTAPKPAPLTAWQLLAEQGRFDEAIHLLLQQVLQQLRQEREIALQDSQTSREILRGGDLQPQRRAGLATIIGAVEYCHFGGRPAGAQLFEHCVEAYRQITVKTVGDVRPA
jgi:hypothetical protein